MSIMIPRSDMHGLDLCKWIVETSFLSGLEMLSEILALELVQMIRLCLKTLLWIY